MIGTGVPNLDLILGGGIPKGDVLLVVGPAGSGKTTLTLQMAFHAAAAGQNVVFISTLSEPPTRLVRHMQGFSFFDERILGKRLFLLSIYPLVSQGLDRVAEALIQAVKEHQASLVIIDGLMTVRDLYPQDVGLRTFIYELGDALRALGATTVITSSGMESLGTHPLPEFTMTDGILELGRQDFGTQTFRTIRSSKMRGLSNLLGQQSLRIDGDGLTVFPRFESVLEPPNTGISPERVPLGMAELDKMMDGGPLAGSSTLLAGSLGTGKTLACVQFLMEGARRGQKGLLIGFRESPRQLIDKARAKGMDLASAIRDGRMAVWHRPPIDLTIDEVSWQIWNEIERLAPQRLALDSIVELEQAVGEERRQRGYMFSLAESLRAKGITSLITKEIPQVVGPELDFSDTPLAIIAENLLLLRYVEFRSELFRIVSVLKMRESDHDHSIRQYAITNEGLKVLAKIESAEGVLTGIARLPSEVRVKRPAREMRREESP